MKFLNILRATTIILFCIAFLWVFYNNNITLQLRSDIYLAVAISTPLHTAGIIFLTIRLSTYLGGTIKKNNSAAVKTILLSQGVELIFPWRLAEFFRVAFLSYSAGISLAKSTATVTKERIGDLIIMSFMTLTSVYIYDIAVSAAVLSIFFLAALFPIFLFYSNRLQNYLGRVAKKFQQTRIQQWIYVFAEEFLSSLSEKGFFIGLGAGVVAWALNLLGIWTYLSVSMSSLPTTHPVGLFQAFFIMTLVVLSGLLPLLPAGIGLFEAAAIFGLTTLGVEISEALAIAIGLHITFLINGIAGTLLILCRERVHFEKLIKK
ncbi:MAG: lysylphosphatidylglycerol synthase transmembrane domain-containing protein [Flavobacteriaceae bacterium]